MGVDISMSMGWGIHIPQDVFGTWLEENDPDEIGGFESLETLLDHYPELVIEWAGNAWIGREQGYVVYAEGTYKRMSMRGGAESGVYRAPKERLSLPAQYQLNEVSKIVTGKHLPIEWLVTVGVS